MVSIPPDASDVELIRQLRLGHQAALAILYDRYGNLVYTVALKVLKQPAEAEDLAQEIFLHLQNKEKFDPNRAALSTYLCVLTRSRALNRIARRGTHQRSLQKLKQSLPERTGATPLEKASLAERKEALQQALATLPEQNRQILDMNFYQGLSHAAIAQQLNIPLGTVKSKARKGLMTLRQHLGEAVQ
ncbi:MAG: sigma-70 family RNA polymerase sigma factor [Cyanobacteria bacterium P01_H01_bin.152]